MKAVVDHARTPQFDLAEGAFFNLLTKEVDAQARPTDEAATRAFEEAKPDLTNRLRRANGQIREIAAAHPEETVDWFGELVIGTCERLRPLLAAGSFELSSFRSSLWLANLSAMLEAVCSSSLIARDALKHGGFLVTSAISGLGWMKGLPADSHSRLLAFLQWWSDEICVGRWGVTDPRGSCYINGTECSPAHAVATEGLRLFVPFATSSGGSANGDFKGRSKDSPFCVATSAGHFDVARAFLDNGLNVMTQYETDSTPSALLLVEMASVRPCAKGGRLAASRRSKDEEYKRALSAFTVEVMNRTPDIMSACTSPGVMRPLTLLSMIFASRNSDLVEGLLADPAREAYLREYFCGPRIVGAVTPYQVLSGAIEGGNPKIIGSIINSGALEGWKRKYTPSETAGLAVRLAMLAVSAFPSNPRYKGDSKYLIEHNPQAMECVEQILATGFVCSFDVNGLNPLLQTLYPYAKGSITGCVIEEAGALTVLKRFHAAGFDVLRTHFMDMGSGYWLPHLTASCGHLRALDWSIQDAGAPAEPHAAAGAATVYSPLVIAIHKREILCARLLLEKYGVEAAYPQKGLSQQPIVALLAASNRYPDRETRDMVCALTKASPGMFTLDCFNEASVAKDDGNRFKTGRVTAWNPVFEFTASEKLETLTCLLKKRLPGVAEIAKRPVVHVAATGHHLNVNALEWAVAAKKWEYVSLFLQYTDARITDRRGRVESVANSFASLIGKADGPPRYMIAMMRARAKDEMSNAKAASVAPPSAARGAGASTSAPSSHMAAPRGATAPGASSNAFEDPSVKPLTEKEEKAKAKKRAAKKRARAKKRAAAKAAKAAAGDAAAEDGPDDAGDSSDDDDDSTDDDYEQKPDDNLVDSRYAPSFELIREELARQAEAKSRGDDEGASESGGASGPS